MKDRITLRLTKEEKNKLQELSNRKNKPMNKIIVEFINEEYDKLPKTNIDPSDCIEAFYPDWDDDMTDGQFSDWLIENNIL